MLLCMVRIFMNQTLLVHNVIEREIKREKVQMKPPYIHIPDIYLGLGFEFEPQRIRDLAFVCP